jgi:hypothetical protein
MLKEILAECVLISIPILVIVGVLIFSKPEKDIKFEDLKNK